MAPSSIKIHSPRLFLTLAVLAFAINVRSQAVSAYAFAQSAGTYTSITGGTALSGSTWDNTVYTVAIPSFPFAGAYHTTMYVSTNGFITFGAPPAANQYDPISTSASYAGAIAAFGADVENSSSGSPLIRWQQVGSEIVVQWSEARRQDVSNERISFQIRLNITTGAINVVYGGTIAPQSSTANYPQVGLRGGSNSFPSNVNNRRVDTSSGAGSTWANSASGTGNDSECRFNNQQGGRAPVVGQTYTWTPPCLPPTTAAAGADQAMCTTISSEVTLVANTPTNGTGSWSQVSGTAATITTPGSPTTTVTGLTTSGNRTFRWTISTGGSCTSSDDVVVTVSVPLNAGPDQTICVSGTATLAATSASPGIGSWAILAGSPSTSTSQLSSTSSPTATFDPSGGAGVYTLRWSTSNSPCASTQDDVAITVSPTPATSAAGADQTLCASFATLAANTPAVGTGAWSIVSVPSGASNSLSQFSNTAASNSTFTPSLMVAGAYTLRWTISNSPCTAFTDNVVINWSAPPQATFTAMDDCANGQFSVQVNVISSGTGANANLQYTVNGGAPTSMPNIGIGTTTIGPFAVGSEVLCTVTNGQGLCAPVQGIVYSSCAVIIPCGTTMTVNHCYRNNDTRTFLFTSNDPSGTVTVTFISGTMASGDVLQAYDGADETGIPLGGLTGSFPNLTNASATSFGQSMFITIVSDGSNSCATGQQTSWEFEVECTGACADPDGVVNVNTTCGTFNFNLDVEILTVGDASDGTTTLRYAVNDGPPVLIPGLTEFQVQNIGPFALTDEVNVRLLHTDNATCDKNLGDHVRNQICPPANDACTSAQSLTVVTPAQCPAQATAGSTLDGNLEIAAPACGGAGAIKDVWYTFNSGWNSSPIAVNIAPGTMTHWGVEIWTACGGSMLSCTTGSPATVNFSGYAAYTDYRIRVFTNTALGNTGSFTMCLSATPLPTSCGTVIRDPGGTGNYSNNQNVTTTHCSGSTQSVIMTFTQFATEAGDDLVRIYDGPTTASTLLGTFSGNTIPGPFISSHPTGCLTVNFTSDGSQTQAGYTANLTCCDKPLPTASASNNGPVCAGTTLQLNATTNIGTVFNWTGPNGFASTLQNPDITNVTTAASGTYTVTVTNGVSGCPRTVSTTVSIIGTPGPANAGPDQTICASPGTATMAATNPATGSGTWTKTGGGAATITSPGSRTTSITGLTDTGSPYTFRWTVSNAPCASLFDEMVVTVNPMPSTANAGSPQTICSNSSALLAANTPGIGSGAWSVVSGPSASASQFSNTAAANATFTPVGGAGTYTLRWTISNAPCTVSTSNVVITVNAAPTGVTANSSAATVCAGNTVNLTATGATDATILTQNFNSGAGGWTTTNTSSGGNPGDAAWTLRPDNYNYSGTTFSSNDDSQFYLTNSDDQGSGGTTATTLVSPAFSTVGYTTASLNFFHYYRYNSGTSDRAFIEVSTNGTTFNTLQTYSSTQGSASNFAQATINLNSVVGQPTVYVRFRYAATFDWWWAVDNVSISGNGSASLTWAWASVPSGFTSGVQNPTGISVPQSTTFTVVATAPNGCTATNSVSVTTVTPSNAGTNGSNAVCSIDAAFSLFAHLNGSQGGGTWSGPSAVEGGMYDPATMVQGVYTYTVAGTSPCPNAAATVTVTETPAVTWFSDEDGDGFGSGAGALACSAPATGDVTNNTDLCPTDPLKQNPGGCGCGVVDVPETYYADTDGDGFGAGDPVADFTCITPAGHVLNNTDLCPADPLKQEPGVCGCGVADVPETYYADADGDGFGAGDPVAGFACITPAGHVLNNTDLCQADPLKQNPGACGCGVADVAVTYYADIDGDGFGAGDPVAGFTCIVPSGHVTNNTDLCPTDANKQAPGQCGCGNPDTDTDGDLTADCNDLCPDDPNKIAPGQCGCGDPDTDSDGDSIADCVDACPLDPNNDQDGDGICGDVDTCPTVFGQVGNICDANPGPGVLLGQLNASCVCVVAGCTQNVTIEFQTDMNPNQITWELREQGTNAVLQAGSLIAPNGVQTVNTCVPNGCYVLKVLDSGGDGIANGGYILRTAGNPGMRIIDNRRNFNSGGVSQITGNEGFCVPFGTMTSAIFSSCDKLDWVTGDYVVCSSVPAVSALWNAGNTPAEATTGYEFQIFNPNGGYIFNRFRSHAVSDGFAPDIATRACHMKINNWAAAQHVPANTLMNVRIRTRINGVNGNWGAACRFKIDPVRAACPLTKLMDIPGDENFSCNSSRAWGTGNYIHARPVSGATQYQWRFRIDAENFVSIRTTTTYFIQLNWVTLPLQNGKTYQVEVRTFKGGAWCVDTQTPAPGPNFTPWGEVCDLTIDNTPMNGGENALVVGQSVQGEGLRMYPNPNRGDALYLSLAGPGMTGFGEEVRTISVDIVDLYGKQVSSRTIAVVDGVVNTVLDLDGTMANGLYMVNITAGEQRYTDRLVIQR